MKDTLGMDINTPADAERADTVSYVRRRDDKRFKIGLAVVTLAMAGAATAFW